MFNIINNPSEYLWLWNIVKLKELVRVVFENSFLLKHHKIAGKKPVIKDFLMKMKA